MKKTTKSLLFSVASLIICISMLMGTTYAWFSDTVESGINEIVAGNLDVELYRVTKNGQKPVDSDTKLFKLSDNQKWEPGAMVYENLVVSNKGDLALKYQLSLNVGTATETEDGRTLADVLKIAIVPGGIAEGKTRDDLKGLTYREFKTFAETGSLKAGDPDVTYGVVVYWEPTAEDNYYNLKDQTGDNKKQLTIEIGVKLFATQFEAESDSFGSDYDVDSPLPAEVPTVNVTKTVNVDDENKVIDPVDLDGTTALASIPEGVLVDDGTTQLTLSVSNIVDSKANVTLGENEVKSSANVHVEGVSEDNTVPMAITLRKFADVGLNEGNISLYHVEDGVTNTMTRIALDATFTAHNQYKYDPATGDVTLYIASFSETTVTYSTDKAWEGNFDYSWYDAQKTELTIASADQLAAFGAIVGDMATEVLPTVDGEIDASKYTWSYVADLKNGSQDGSFSLSVNNTTDASDASSATFYTSSNSQRVYFALDLVDTNYEPHEALYLRISSKDTDNSSNKLVEFYIPVTGEDKGNVEIRLNGSGDVVSVDALLPHFDVYSTKKDEGGTITEFSVSREGLMKILEVDSLDEIYVEMSHRYHYDGTNSAFVTLNPMTIEFEYRGDSFSGKTVKLVADINLGYNGSEGYHIFYPIGYNSSDGKYEKTDVAVTTGFYTFGGTFDGGGHTIANFYQNTWDMKGDNNYYDAELQYYRDGMGLFGKVYGGTVKNLTVENFSSDGEFTTTGCIAAYAEGATFENITIFNCNPRVYNIGNGGIVGCVGWYAKEAGLRTTFKNITVDNSNKISALWGSWDVACGGLVGQYYPTSGQSAANYPANGGIHFENCHVAAEIDVYNDVCANYQYYAYRYAGMMIGSIRENETKDGHVYPKMDGITATDCTVHFDDWVNHYYCELVANSLASYTHDHQMSRLTKISSVSEIQDAEGNWNKQGNFVLLAADSDEVTCYHIFKDANGNLYQHSHEDSGTETVNGSTVLKEDKQCVYLKFNQLFTGYGWGVTSKGIADFKGIKIIDIIDTDNEKSESKFVSGNFTSVPADVDLRIGALFAENPEHKIDINPKAVMVSVEPVENAVGDADVVSSVTFKRHNTIWEYGTLKITGTGTVKITIQDYYYCEPTVITVDLVNNSSETTTYDKIVAKSDTAITVYDGIEFRVGDIFTENPACAVAIVASGVNVTADNEAVIEFKPDSNDWKNGTIKLKTEGEFTLTIADANSCNAETATVKVIAQPGSVVDGIISDSEYTWTSGIRYTDGDNTYPDFAAIVHDTTSDGDIKKDLAPNATSVQIWMREDSDYVYIGYREENPVSSDTTIYFDFNPRLDWNSRGQVMCDAAIKSDANGNPELSVHVYEYYQKIIDNTKLDLSRDDVTEDYIEVDVNDPKYAFDCSYGVNVIEIKLEKSAFANYAFNAVKDSTNTASETLPAYTGTELLFNTVGFRAFGQDPEIGFRETWGYGDKQDKTPTAFHILGNEYGYISQNITLEKYNPTKIDGVIDENEYKWNSGLKNIKLGDIPDDSENFVTIIKKETTLDSGEKATPSSATSVQFYMHEDSEYLYVAYQEKSTSNSTAIYLDFNPRLNSENSTTSHGQVMVNARVNNGALDTIIVYEYYNSTDGSNKLDTIRQVSTGKYIDNVSTDVVVNSVTALDEVEGVNYTITTIEIRLKKSAFEAYAFEEVLSSVGTVSLPAYDGNKTTFTTIGFRAFGQNYSSQNYEIWAYGIKGDTSIPNAFHVQPLYEYITQNIVLKKPTQN